MTDEPPRDDHRQSVRPPNKMGVRGPDKHPGQRVRRSKPRIKPSVLSHPCAYLSRGRPIIKWTRDKQALAISDGWFFERDMATNYVRLRSLPNGAFKDASQAWSHLTQQCFRNSVFHAIAIAFAEQQALHQYTDAWDKRCSAYHPRLRWFKDLAVVKRTNAQAFRGPKGQWRPR